MGVLTLAREEYDIEMTKTENMEQDEHEILQERVWQGSSMIGNWTGTGWWNEGKYWRGLGTWQGGLLAGTWDGMGEWETIGDEKGKWKGNGDLISSMAFQKYAAFLFLMKGLAPVIIGAAIIGLAAIIARGLISSWIGVVIGFAAILVLFLVSIVIGKLETTKGEWWGEGTWEDDGEFRILEMNAKWKLGYHEGIFRGKMKDPKPR